MLFVLTHIPSELKFTSCFLKHTCTLLLRLSVPVQHWLSPLSRDPRVVSLSISVWLCFIGCGSVWYDSSLSHSLPHSLSLPLSSIPLFYCLCKYPSWRLRQGAKWFYTAINFSFFNSQLIMAFLFFLLACFSGLKSFLASILICLLPI